MTPEEERAKALVDSALYGAGEDWLDRNGYPDTSAMVRDIAAAIREAVEEAIKQRADERRGGEMRKYTVAEINRMRDLILASLLPMNGSLPMFSGDINQIAEDQLRTYMQNGTEPDELVPLAEPCFRFALGATIA